MSDLIELVEFDEIDVDLSEVVPISTPVKTEDLSVTPTEEPQTIRPSAGKYFKEVNVEGVPLAVKSINKNGKYLASDEQVMGFKEVEVNVPSLDSVDGVKLVGQAGANIEVGDAVLQKLEYEDVSNLIDSTSLEQFGFSYACAISPDNKFIYVQSTDVSKSIVYNTETKEQFSLPDDININIGKASFTPDGRYLALPLQSSPYLIIYDTSTMPFTRVDISTINTVTHWAVAFSPDGKYMAVSLGSSPYGVVYDISAGFNNLVKLNATSILSGNSQSCAFSPDSRYVTFTSNGNFFVYRIDGEKLTKLSTPYIGSQRRCTYSEDGTQLIIGLSSSPFIKVFSVNGNTYTDVTNSVIPEEIRPKSMGYDCIAWGNRVLITDIATSFESNAPSPVVYDTSNPQQYKLADDFPIFGTFNSFNASVSSKYLIYTHNSGKTFTLYDRENMDKVILSKNKSLTNKNKYGISLGSATTGEDVEMLHLFGGGL